MKTIRSLWLGILLGITAIVAMGIVYIDNVKHYWQFSGGFVRLVVNTNTQASITVDTNTLSVGINTNNSARSFIVRGRTPATNATGNGTSSALSGTIRLHAGDGGQTAETTTASGGSAGSVELVGGIGGNANAAVTNATGGAGGGFSMAAGNGGPGASSAGAATNAVTGGNGGTVSVFSGAGGTPDRAATNTVGGAGGTMTFGTGGGATPSAGWARKGGDGGAMAFNAGVGGNGVRTNGGSGGGISFTAGNAGIGSTGGDPGTAGDVSFNGGAGGSGATNGNGGNLFMRGGNPASTATPGNVIIGRNSSGSARGGLIVGLGTFTITNIIGGALELDFPSTAAGTVSDLPITVTGTTSNGCSVVLGIPWEMAQGGGAFAHFTSNNTVFVRFVNNQLAAAIDPSPGTVTAIVLKNQ